MKDLPFPIPRYDRSPTTFSNSCSSFTFQFSKCSTKQNKCSEIQKNKCKRQEVSPFPRARILRENSHPQFIYSVRIFPVYATAAVAWSALYAPAQVPERARSAPTPREPSRPIRPTLFYFETLQVVERRFFSIFRWNVSCLPVSVPRQDKNRLVSLDSF